MQPIGSMSEKVAARADGGHLLRNIQANDIANHRAGLPDRDNIGGSLADRDYRMSRHDNAIRCDQHLYSR
jgi:hypothetical protein